MTAKETSDMYKIFHSVGLLAFEMDRSRMVPSPWLDLGLVRTWPACQRDQCHPHTGTSDRHRMGILMLASLLQFDSLKRLDHIGLAQRVDMFVSNHFFVISPSADQKLHISTSAGVAWALHPCIMPVSWSWNTHIKSTWSCLKGSKFHSSFIHKPLLAPTAFTWVYTKPLGLQLPNTLRTYYHHYYVLKIL